MPLLQITVNLDPETGDATGEVRVDGQAAGTASGLNLWRALAAAARDGYDDAEVALAEAEDTVTDALTKQQHDAEELLEKRTAAMRAWTNETDA